MQLRSSAPQICPTVPVPRVGVADFGVESSLLTGHSTRVAGVAIGQQKGIRGFWSIASRSYVHTHTTPTQLVTTCSLHPLNQRSIPRSAESYYLCLWGVGAAEAPWYQKQAVMPTAVDRRRSSKFCLLISFRKASLSRLLSVP